MTVVRRSAPPPIDPMFETYLRENPRISYVQPADPWLRRAMASLLERACGRDTLERIYHDLKDSPVEPADFFAEALAATGIDVDLLGTPTSEIPEAGPLLFVA